MLYKGQNLEEYKDTGARTNHSVIKDLTGSTVGRWSVICRAPRGSHGRSFFWVECTCGKIKKLEYSFLINGESKGCIKCARQQMLVGKVKKVGEIPVAFWHKFRSKVKYGREFSVSIEQAWELFLKQDRKCALSGIPIAFTTEVTFDKKGNKSHWKNTASLDRIDSLRGYTIDNIQWVHKDINFLKQEYQQDYFIDLCKNVARDKKKILKIGFSGVPGSGKTTMANALSTKCATIDKLKHIEVVQEYAREHLLNYGDIKDTLEQYNVFLKQIEWEDNSIALKPDIIITDSPIFLSFIYSCELSKNSHKNAMFFIDTFKKMTKLNYPEPRYDIIFHLCPIIRPVKDGVRPEQHFDEEWRKNADMMIRSTMKIFKPKQFYVMEQSDLEDRIEFCLDKIKRSLE